MPPVRQGPPLTGLLVLRHSLLGSPRVEVNSCWPAHPSPRHLNTDRQTRRHRGSTRRRRRSQPAPVHALCNRLPVSQLWNIFPVSAGAASLHSRVSEGGEATRDGMQAQPGGAQEGPPETRPVTINGCESSAPGGWTRGLRPCVCVPSRSFVRSCWAGLGWLVDPADRRPVSFWPGSLFSLLLTKSGHRTRHGEARTGLDDGGRQARETGRSSEVESMGRRRRQHPSWLYVDVPRYSTNILCMHDGQTRRRTGRDTTWTDDRQRENHRVKAQADRLGPRHRVRPSAEMAISAAYLSFAPGRRKRRCK